MGKPTGFIEYQRETPERRPVAERVQDYREVYQPFPEETLKTQAARCMDCGVPFCQSGSGCPSGRACSNRRLHSRACSPENRT